MLSLRTFSRSLPRATARLTSSAIKSVSKPAFQSSLRATAIRTPVTAFSTSARRWDASAQELAAKLESELNLEEKEAEETTDSEAGVSTFLEQNSDWTLQQGAEGEQDVILTRKYDDEDITVAFSIADFNNPMVEDDADEPWMGEEEDEPRNINQARPDDRIAQAPEDSIAPADQEDPEDPEGFDSQRAYPANISVLIQRPGKGALRAILVADEGQFTIQAITYVPANMASTKSTTDLLREAPDSLYAGPPFNQLDDDLQDKFQAYFEERGVNTALALFVPNYIDVKEQQEYLGWLARVRDFVE